METVAPVLSLSVGLVFQQTIIWLGLRLQIQCLVWAGQCWYLQLFISSSGCCYPHPGPLWPLISACGFPASQDSGGRRAQLLYTGFHPTPHGCFCSPWVFCWNLKPDSLCLFGPWMDLCWRGCSGRRLLKTHKSNLLCLFPRRLLTVSAYFPSVSLNELFFFFLNTVLAWW